MIIPRLHEYKVLFYRIGLVYVFYFICRILFYIFNKDIIPIHDFSEFITLFYHGIAFDTTAIIYINSIFILLSVLPLKKTISSFYQKFLLVIYFVFNGIGLGLNFIDFIYYRYNYARLNRSVFDVIEHETNKIRLFNNFLFNYWYVFVLFLGCFLFWVYLYSKIKNPSKSKINYKYYTVSIFMFLLIATFSVGGIRGDFRYSTRPINLADAGKYVNSSVQSDFVLNSTFAFIRTWNTQTFTPFNFFQNQEDVFHWADPVKHYPSEKINKKNVVIFIMESFGREYIGSFNPNTTILNYKGYAPFIDSLAQNSLIFTNAYANGYKSIHGVSSVIAGIPSFKDAYTSSSYVIQPVESLVSVLNQLGYTTSFFHNAPNGSMGHLGFSKILGYQRYFGMTEYNNNKDFDGSWGIWDEPFFQFFSTQLGQQKRPFMATLFSSTSHEPYVIPEQYNGKFDEGNSPMHKCIGYSDYALKRFFESAKKQPWFQNTIFVITADHGNLTYYDQYKKPYFHHTVPILFYTPTHDYKGVDDLLAQQIDIYPTVLNMIGYDKPFRSWGNSLLDKNADRFVVKYNFVNYMYAYKDYLYETDGKKPVALYHKSDFDLKNNLLNQKKRISKDTIQLKSEAFLQDYMDRIVYRKMNNHNIP